MKNVMIDLETLGTSSGSAILSIGAVFFSSDGLGAEFYVKIDLNSCVQAGLSINPDTVLWWLKQSDEARLELTTGLRKPIFAALQDFSEFILSPEPVKVWGNGSDFDNALLGAAYLAVNLPIPWKFTNNRCYRTLKNLRPDILYPQDLGTHHKAIDDAVGQATHAIQLCRALNFDLGYS